jgi:heme exporter protein B
MRRKDTLISMGMVALITLFLFSFAIGTEPLDFLETRPAEASARGRGLHQQLTGGILWVTFLLAGTIGIERAFRGDGDGRQLEGLLLSPVSRPTIYHARVASTFLFVVTMEAVTLVLFLVLFNQSLDGASLFFVLAATAATTLGFVEVGVLISAMTWSVRGGDVLLRILLFPLLIPIFYAAVSVTSDAFAGKAPGVEEIGVIAAFDVMFLGAGHLLFEHVVKDFEAQG